MIEAEEIPKNNNSNNIRSGYGGGAFVVGARTYI